MSKAKPIKAGKKKGKELKSSQISPYGSGCMNADCKLRKAGCTGFDGCPGYKGK